MAPSEERENSQEDETYLVNDVGNGLRRRRLLQDYPGHVDCWERSKGGDNETVYPPLPSQEVAYRSGETRRAETSADGQSHDQPTGGVRGAVAATAKNLKGTYIRRLRDQAGIIRGNTSEIAARAKSFGSLPALEQEVTRLSEELRLLKSERDAALKKVE